MQRKLNFVISKLHLVVFFIKKKRSHRSHVSVNSPTMHFAPKLFQESKVWMGCT